MQSKVREMLDVYIRTCTKLLEGIRRLLIFYQIPFYMTYVHTYVHCTLVS